MKITMKSKLFTQSAAPAAMCLLLGMVPALQAAVVFEDSFKTFALGTQWQAHGAGAPEVALGIVGLGADGSSLRMGSAAGAAGEAVGIQTAANFPLSGVTLVRVTARLRPLNQTAAGEGGASDASAGVSILGSSGAFTQASAASSP